MSLVPVYYSGDTNLGSHRDYVRVYFYDTVQKAEVDFDADDVVFSNHPELTFGDEYIRAEDEKIHQYCSGTTLHEVSVKSGLTASDFPPDTDESNVNPYTSEATTANSSSCVAACDITVLSVQESINGANYDITINAESSFSGIKYSLDNETFQVSNQFTVSPGRYTVYTKDSEGCTFQKDFKIPSEDSYGVIYRSEYKSFKGDNCKIDILKRDYTGSVESVIGGGTPISILYGASESEGVYEPYLGSEAKVRINSDTDFKYLDLFTSDELKYRCDYYRNDSLVWTGFINPESYNEPYTDPEPGYMIQASFTDGIGRLKDESYVDANGNKIFGKAKLLNVIIHCLQKTGNLLPLRTSIDVIHENMGASEDVLNQTYIDQSAYIEDNEPLTCFEVLKRNLQPLGARLWQEDGIWWIVSVERFVGSFDYFDYDAFGENQTTGTYNPQKDLTSAQASPYLRMLSDANLEMEPGLSEYKVVQDYLKKPSIIRNHSFKETDPTTNQVFKYWKSKTSVSSIEDFETKKTIADGDEEKIICVLEDPGTQDGLTPSNERIVSEAFLDDIDGMFGGGSTSLSIEIRLQNRASSSKNVNFQIIVGSYYLNFAGGWNFSQNTISISAPSKEWKDFKLETDTVPAGGYVEVTIFTIPGETLWIDYVQMIYQNDSGELPSEDEYIAENPTRGYKQKKEVKIFQGSRPINTVSAGQYKGIMYSSLNDLSSLGPDFKIKGQSHSRSLFQVLGDRLINGNSRPKQKIKGTIKSSSINLKPSMTISDTSTAQGYFIPMSLEINDKENEVDGDWVEILDVENNYMLQEDGYPILQEDGSKIELEG